MITIKEAFQLGFITKCQEDGLNADQIVDLVDKAATIKQSADKKPDSKPIIPGHDWAQQEQSRHTLPQWAGIGTGIGLGAAGVGGAALGLLAAKLRGNYMDEDDVKRQELINTYKTLTSRTRPRSV